ncbi:LuxR family transcriptional regulator [Sinosporangium siamense]|uniref:LuxR family transcriptional regulator n=1 Tax=Sinosporangium siamense TaxID=1367973 RepID=A0A919VB94_9ACTN|nr:LuxR family transcriptional regulator [Sinosporangium siamense]
MVDGQPGIGKTALVRHFLSRNPDVTAMWASGEQNESRLSYGTIDQFRGVEAEVADPLEAGAALLETMGDLQAGGEVAVILDDAHWADTASLHAITFALRRLRADRIMAIVIVRDPDDHCLPEGLRRLLAAESTARISLAGLDAEEVRRLGDTPLPLRVASRLRDHTSGNPLHIRALLEQVPADVLADLTSPLPAPRSYAMLVLSRLADCDSRTQRLVEAMSVLGASAPLWQAARLAGLMDPVAALDQAVTARLLEERSTENGVVVAFPHPLVQAAVYRDLGPARRMELHGQAAEVTGDELAGLNHRLRSASHPDDTLVAELAAFARREAGAGLWSSAAVHLTRAARLARAENERVRLTADALEALLLDGQVTGAVTLTRELPQGCPVAISGYAHGALAFVTGRLNEAYDLLTDAWEHCVPDDEPILAARIAENLAALCVMRAEGAQGAWWAGQALRLAPGRPGMGLARYLRLAGLGISGNIATALALLPSLPNPEFATSFELDAILGRGVLRTWADDLEGALRDLAGVVTASAGRSVPFRLLAASMLGYAEYRAGLWDDAVVHAEISTSIADGAGQVWHADIAHGFASWVPAARGEWDQAAEHLKAAAGLRLAGTATYATVCSAEAHLAVAKGHHDQVVAVLKPLADLGHREGSHEPGVIAWQDLLADAYIAVGEDKEAEAILIPCERLARQRGRHSVLAACARVRGNLHAFREEHSAADEAFQAGLVHLARISMPFESARLRLAYGEFLRRWGKRALAAEQLRAARDVLKRLGARPYLQRCERELAACGLRTSAGHARQGDLTPQEQAVARLAVTGIGNRQIARELMLSTKTVEYHLSHIYAKLGVTSRAALIAISNTDT